MKPVRWLLPALVIGAALFLAGCPGKDGMMNDDEGMMEDDGMSLRPTVQMQLPA